MKIEYSRPPTKEPTPGNNQQDNPSYIDNEYTHMQGKSLGLLVCHCQILLKTCDETLPVKPYVILSGIHQPGILQKDQASKNDSCRLPYCHYLQLDYGSYIEIPDHAALNPASGITLEGWVRLDNYAAANYFVCELPTHARGDGLGFGFHRVCFVTKV